MAGAKTKCRLHIGQRPRQILPRQRVHQVEVKALEVTARQINGRSRLLPVVNAPDGRQPGIVKALDAQRKAVDPRLPEAMKPSRFRCPRIGLQRDLDIGRPRQQGPNAGQQAIDRLRREQAGRPATEENADNRPPPHQGQG